MGEAAVGAERSGLTSAEATQRLAQYGPNQLPSPQRTSMAKELLRQFTHVFALLLWVASALAAVAGMPQLAVAIVVVILVNGVFAFVQEFRADRAVAKLRDLLPVQAAVRRDGGRRIVPATELVPGDVVLLESGDRVSADLRLLISHGLAVDESLLTGESVPRRPGGTDQLFAGTFVVEGAGEAEVVTTGEHTRLAGIAAITRGVRHPRGPLAVRLSRLVTVVAIIAVSVGAVLFGLSLLLALDVIDAFIFALGVTVALVPEGLLPTVTLSLALGARTMADRRALVKRLEAVETLGSVTFICTDKTGTLTRNEMVAVRIWTPAGTATSTGSGYEPEGEIVGTDAVREAVSQLAYSAVRASTGRLVPRDGRYVPQGDPMEVALYVLARRAGIDLEARFRAEPTQARLPFERAHLRAAAITGGGEAGVLHVKGAPEALLAACTGDTAPALAAAHEMADSGLRVLAVARGAPVPTEQLPTAAGLSLLGVVGLLDPPRPEAADAVATCRSAHIKLALVTGDHPGTARAVANQVGLALDKSPVLTGSDLPDDEGALGELIDHDGIVLARVTPEQKLRIARALRSRGHAIAMTGDGVNDAPALRTADIGIAMGATGSDVARESADLILLDDNFATIVAAIRLGRATFANIRRFLTYHLTDNVAELAPFVVWAITGGAFPLAIGVLQVLALDIGTDIFPALALGAEPPNPRTLSGQARTEQLIDRRVLLRAFGVLGPAEVLASLGTFVVVLRLGGWSFGTVPAPGLQAVASGAAFAAIVLGQLANAYACRSQSQPFYRLDPRRNRLLLFAIGSELILLMSFLGIGPVARVLGGSWPTTAGWLLALLAVPIVLLVDTLYKRLAAHRSLRETPK